MIVALEQVLSVRNKRSKTRVTKSLANLLHVKKYLKARWFSNSYERKEVARRKKEIFLSKMKEYYKYWTNALNFCLFES